MNSGFSDMYDYIVVTHLPVFYKVNLYNELAKKMNIYVVFISQGTTEKRSEDFIALNNANFTFKVIGIQTLQERGKFISLCRLFLLFGRIKSKKVLICGWDLVEFWMLIVISSRNKNCLVLESTAIESSTVGFRGVLKKIFLTRIGTVFASGELHSKLLEQLSFQREIIITKGVGLINKPDFEPREIGYNRRFLYVGRLSKVKNLELLVEVFNKLPLYTLTLVGCGEEEGKLIELAEKNVIFLGALDNTSLKEQYQKHDVLVLPSLSEPWGLVVEEAIFFGMPVIVSSNCGASELIEHGVTGFVFDPGGEDELIDVINSIDERVYNELLTNIPDVFINIKDALQVSAYALS